MIAKRFTLAVSRDLDLDYICQLENTFDLFLMQNPVLVPGNADTVERLKTHLLRANTDRARLEVELTSYMIWTTDSKETMEMDMKYRLNKSMRANVLRRMALQTNIDRVEGKDCGPGSEDDLHSKYQRRHRHHRNYLPHQTANFDCIEPTKSVFLSISEQSSFDVSSSILPSSNNTLHSNITAKYLHKG